MSEQGWKGGAGTKIFKTGKDKVKGGTNHNTWKGVPVQKGGALLKGGWGWDPLRTMDVILLANVFNAFRGMCLEYYLIDLAHCFTTPGLSCQAAPKLTGAELELIDIVNMH